MNKQQVLKEMSHKDTVSFNYPKYETEGTPHKIWIKNVEFVEKCLEKIINTQPWPDELPLAYMKREDKDLSGNITNVHLDVYGKLSMVKYTLEMLDKYVQKYVASNMIFSNKMFESFKSIVKNHGTAILSDANFLETLAYYLSEKGLDVSVLGEELPEDIKVKINDAVAKYELKKSGLGTASTLNEVEKSIAEEEAKFSSDENQDVKDMLPNSLLMPNPDPDDFN